MPNQPDIREEVLALRASAAVLLQQADKLLAKMNRKPSKKKVDMQHFLAEIHAKRQRTLLKAQQKSRQL